LRGFAVNWRAGWGREERSGSTRFVLDYAALYADSIEGIDRLAYHRGRTIWGLSDDERRLMLGY
jgi:hypothetical protein